MSLPKNCEEKTAEAFSKYITTDMNERPINKLIEDMQARLEEFQTMVYFAKQESSSSVNQLTAVYNNNKDLEDLFYRIDHVENLVEHVKKTLASLEQEVEKAEEEVGFSDSTTNKVANIFTPLFKKSAERSQSPSPSHTYKTSDFFYPSCEIEENE